MELSRDRHVHIKHSLIALDIVSFSSPSLHACCVGDEVGDLKRKLSFSFTKPSILDRQISPIHQKANTLHQGLYLTL